VTVKLHKNELYTTSTGTRLYGVAVTSLTCVWEIPGQVIAYLD